MFILDRIIDDYVTTGGAVRDAAAEHHKLAASYSSRGDDRTGTRDGITGLSWPETLTGAA